MPFCYCNLSFEAKDEMTSNCSLFKIVIWFIIPTIRSSRADHTNNALVLIVLLQYIPRLYLIFPATGVVTKTAWAGAAYNLLLYMLASHVRNASLNQKMLAFIGYTTCCSHKMLAIAVVSVI